jgi:hypothetical protein
MKQLILACHNYHDKYQALTHASGGPYGPTTTEPGRWSGLVPILPFIEQEPVYNLYTSINIGTPWQTYTIPTVGTLAPKDNPKSVIIDTFLCPSDGAGKIKPVNRTAATNYRLCLGDNAIAWGDTVSKYGIRGIFGYRTYYEISAVTDGSSNTVFYSERPVVKMNNTAIGQSTRIKVVTVSGNATIMGFTSVTTPIGSTTRLTDRTKCAGLAGTKGEYDTTVSGISYNPDFGWSYCDGTYYNTCFMTVMPPNSPSCYQSAANYNMMTTAASYHPGGVQCALGDGSVRFVSETIDAGTATAFPTPAEATGESPFGIWGALGSRDGGESKSIQ